MARCTMRPKKLKKLLMRGAFVLLFLTLNLGFAQAAELPLVRIAYGAFRETVLALWVGVEQGFFASTALTSRSSLFALVVRP